MTPPRVDRNLSFTHHGRTLVYDRYIPPSGSGPVVVYTHGLLLDSELNRGIAQALAERGNTVITLDLLGHGRSDRPTHASEYRIDSYGEQVIALLDHLDEPTAVLGGISLGANVSLFAAAAHPERVRGLVLEMPVLEWAVPAAALVFSPLLLLAHYAKTPLGLVTGLVRRTPRTPFGPLNSLLNSGSTDPEIMAAVLHGVLVGPVAPTGDARRSITAPTLVLAHRNDIIHPFDDAATLVRQMPHAHLVRAHSPLELRLRPQRLTAEIAAFVDTLATDPRSAIGHR